MVQINPHYRTHAPQTDLFQGDLERVLSEGVGIRNPELIARKARREVAIAETKRLAYEDALRNSVIHDKLQKLAHNLKHR